MDFFLFPLAQRARVEGGGKHQMETCVLRKLIRVYPVSACMTRLMVYGNFYANFTPHLTVLFSSPSSSGGWEFQLSCMNLYETWIYYDFPPPLHPRSSVRDEWERKKIQIISGKARRRSKSVMFRFAQRKMYRVVHSCRWRLGTSLLNGAQAMKNFYHSPVVAFFMPARDEKLAIFFMAGKYLPSLLCMPRKPSPTFHHSASNNTRYSSSSTASRRSMMKTWKKD